MKEGIAKEKIVRVGNIMIDSLEMLRPKIEAANTVKKYGLENGSYGLVTLHRPSNVDDRDTERPITITQGTNRLCTTENVEDNMKEALENKESDTRIPEFWEGKTADRVVKSIMRLIV